jgi:mRNA interferase HigB
VLEGVPGLILIPYPKYCAERCKNLNRIDMLIIHLSKLVKFYESHANSRKNLVAWKVVVEKATWKNKHHVLMDFPKAKIIKNNRARFEIAHNAYRLIVQINYEDEIVEIRFIGTHNEYEKINPETI